MKDKKETRSTKIWKTMEKFNRPIQSFVVPFGLAELFGYHENALEVGLAGVGIYYGYRLADFMHFYYRYRR